MSITWIIVALLASAMAALAWTVARRQTTPAASRGWIFAALGSLVIIPLMIVIANRVTGSSSGTGSIGTGSIGMPAYAVVGLWWCAVAAAGAWVVGSIATTARVISGWTRVRRMVRGSDADPAATLRLRELTGDAALDVTLHDGDVPPCLWWDDRGVTIAVPRRLWRRLSADQRDTLLWHERTHLLHGDHRIRLVMLGVQIIVWWHPLTRRLINAQRDYEESMCDAVAARHVGGPAAYASSLINIVAAMSVSHESVTGRRTGVLMAIFGDTRLADVLRRIVSGAGAEPATELRERLLRLARHHDDDADGGPWAGWSWMVVAAGLIFAWGLPTLRLHPIPGSPPRIAERSATKPLSPLATRRRNDRSESRRANGLPRTNDRRVVKTDLMVPAVLPPRPTGWWSRRSPAGPRRLSVDAKMSIEMMPGGGGQFVVNGDRVAPPHPEWTVVERIGSDRPSNPQISVTGLLTGSIDGSVRLWDAQTARPRSLVGRHAAAITAIAIVPDTTVALVGDDDGNVVAWNLDAGTSNAAWNADQPIRSIRWSGNALYVLTGHWMDADDDVNALLYRIDPKTLDPITSIRLDQAYATIVTPPKRNACRRDADCDGTECDCAQCDGVECDGAGVDGVWLATWGGELKRFDLGHDSHRRLGNELPEAIVVEPARRSIDKTLVSAILFSSLSQTAIDRDWQTNHEPSDIH